MPFYNGVPTRAELAVMLSERGSVIYRDRNITHPSELPADTQILEDYRMPANTPVPTAGAVGARPVAVAQPSVGATTLHTDSYLVQGPPAGAYLLTYVPRGYVSLYHNGLRVRPTDFTAAGQIVGLAEALYRDLTPGDELQIVYNREV